MNRKELVQKISKASEMSTKKVEKFLKAFTDVVTDALYEEDEVPLHGLGTFKVSERKARKGRNPATGETIQIAAKNAVSFKVSKTLKDAVNAD